MALSKTDFEKQRQGLRMKRKAKILTDEQCEALAQAIEQLLSVSGLNATKLANEIGVSPSTISCWKSPKSDRASKLIPNENNCLRMALISASYTDGCDPIAECERWLSILGYEMSRQDVESFVASNGLLRSKFNCLFDEVVISLFEKTNLPIAQARQVAVARLSQLAIEGVLQPWLRESPGFIELSVFWSAVNDVAGIRSKLRNPALRKELIDHFRLIGQPLELINAPGQKCRPRVCKLNLVIHHGTTEEIDGLAKWLRENDLFPTSEWPDLKVYTPRRGPQRFEHLADCWIYNKPGFANKFSYLITSPDDLAPIVINSGNREISERPGNWMFQPTPMSPTTTSRFLEHRFITRDADGSLCFDESVWEAR